MSNPTEDERTWEVSIPISVTAPDRERAIEYALDDLRDPDMEWTDFIVKQTGGPHAKVPHGRCEVCGHYGDDCEGSVDERYFRVTLSEAQMAAVETALETLNPGDPDAEAEVEATIAAFHATAEEVR